MECVPSRQHMSLMRARQREERWLDQREAGYHRGSIPSLLVQRQALPPSLSAWWCHHTTPSYCPQYSALLRPPPPFFPLAPASSPPPPRLLRQRRLPRSNNPLSWPGSLALTTVHPVALMAYEQSILFTLKKRRKRSFKHRPGFFFFAEQYIAG